MSSTKARHRKDARPVTSVTPVARRSLAAAATSGLALTMIASSASAAATGSEAAASAGTVGARAAMSTNAAVQISPDASAANADIAADVTAEAPVIEQPAPKANTAETTTTTADSSASATADNAAATSETQAAPTPASNAGGAVAIAMQYVGRPYVSGAAGPDAFDCSGLVQYVYAQMGISLPRTAQAQGSAGTLVSAAEAQPGDIVYFGHHVGIYAGDGKMIDAGTESTGVVYRDIYETPIGYVRVG